MALRQEKKQRDESARSYVVIADHSTFDRAGDPSSTCQTNEYDKESHKTEYERQLQYMKAFHHRLTDWISIKGISDEIFSLEEPSVPMASLVLFCTPASALTIEQMPGVKAVIEEP